jgi:hypothetical protein
MVPIRRLTASNPALSPVSVANNSALFLNTGIWCPATTGSGTSSRHGTSSTPAYTPMVLAKENRRTPHTVAALSALSKAEGVGPEVLDRIGQVVAARREMHDAGDLVPLPDVEEGRLVRGVQRIDDDPAAGLVGEVLRQLGGPVRGEHDGFAQVEQCPCGARPDRTQAAGNEYHSYPPQLADNGRASS